MCHTTKVGIRSNLEVDPYESVADDHRKLIGQYER